MATTLFDNLTAKTQREIAGSDSSKRFDYQKDWAFNRMLDLHIEGKDYLVAFEFHDDVLFLDSETSPTSIDFFQVKTQKKAALRKLSTFLSKGKAANSIIGKLCHNLDGICKSHSLNLILVSNLPYEFSTTNITASQLPKKYKDAIIDQIKIEHPALSADFLERLHFYVTDMPLDTAPTYLQGKALELFKKRFGEVGSYNVFSWIRLVQGEIKRKNNFPSNEIASVDELKNKKCVGKSFIENTLDDVEKTHRNAPDLQFIKGEFKDSGWTLQDILRFDKAFPKAFADYQDPTNDECRNIIADIEKILSAADLQNDSLPKVVESAFESLKANTNIPFPYSDRMYLISLIVMIYNEKI